MAEEAKDKKGNKVKFIRKNGKVIPIRAKGAGGGDNKTKKPSGSKQKRKSVKSLKSTEKAHYSKSKSLKKSGSRFSLAAGATAGLGLVAGLGGMKKTAVGLVAGAIGLHLKGRSQKKRARTERYKGGVANERIAIKEGRF